MSRRDVIILLERLSLDHRASLAEKACAYLLSVESNRTLKSHPSHAAICVDIAADQLDIEVSRQALVRLSGAPSPVAYNTTMQTIRRYLLGERTSSTAASSSAATPSLSRHSLDSLSSTVDGGDSSNAMYCQAVADLITKHNASVLKQLSIKRGSMELNRLVLECLAQFFDKWVASLTPAQRAHVDYADLKWVGAAFWLCSLARQRQIKVKAPTVAAAGAAAAHISSASSSATPAPVDSAEQSGNNNSKQAGTAFASAAPASAPTKRLGGTKSAKELKDMILEMLQHRVTTKELDKTIRLMEDVMSDYLLSLSVQKIAGIKKLADSASSSGSGGRRKRKSTDQDSESGTSTTAQSDTEMASADLTTTSITTAPAAVAGGLSGRRTPTISSSTSVTPLRRAAAKRTISNISDISIDGGRVAAPAPKHKTDSPEVDMAQFLQPPSAESATTGETPSVTSSAQPPSVKRARMEGDHTPKSRVSSSSKRTSLSAAATTAVPTIGSPLGTAKRRAGGVYTMIPRIKYQQTKAYQHYTEWRKRILEKLSS